MSTAIKELIGGGAYTAIAKYAGIVVNIIITAVLARILVPSDVGTVAIATVLINFFSMLSDMGIGPAIIQNRYLDKNDLKNIFSLTAYLEACIPQMFSSSLGRITQCV